MATGIVQPPYYKRQPPYYKRPACRNCKQDVRSTKKKSSRTTSILLVDKEKESKCENFT